MDPMTMMLVGTVITAGATIYGGATTAAARRSQAASGEAKARADAEWAQRRALEDRVTGQRTAADDMRTARIAQSRLTALAGASGGGAADPTVTRLWEGIEAEGQGNAAKSIALAEQKAAGTTYQAALNSWTAGENAKMLRRSADATIIGSVMSATGQAVSGYGMAQRYPSPAGTTGGTGYGGGGYDYGYF